MNLKAAETIFTSIIVLALINFVLSDINMKTAIKTFFN